VTGKTERVIEWLAGEGTREVFLTLPELRAHLHMHKDTLKNLLAKGGVEGIGDEHNRVYSLNAVQAALAKLTKGEAQTEGYVGPTSETQDEFLSILKYGTGPDGFEPLGDGLRRRWN
jgi:hypothetical protein